MTAAKWFNRLAMFVLDAESDAVGALTFPERQRYFERPAVEVCGGTAKVGRFVPPPTAPPAPPNPPDPSPHPTRSRTR